MKKIICCLISTALLLSVAGCGKGGGSIELQTPPVPEEIATPTPSAMPTLSPLPPSSPEPSPPPEPALISSYPIQIDMTDLLSACFLEEDGTFLGSIKNGWNGEWMELYLYGGSEVMPGQERYEEFWYDEQIDELTYYGITYAAAQRAGWGEQWKQLTAGQEGTAISTTNTLAYLVGDYCYDGGSFQAPNQFVNFYYSLSIEEDGDGLIITNAWRGNNFIDHVKVGMDDLYDETFIFSSDGDEHSLRYMTETESPYGAITFYLDGNMDMPYLPVNYEPANESGNEISSSVAEGTTAYFRFKTEVGQYVVKNGNYVLSSAWTWTNNEQVSAHQHRTNNQLPPVPTSIHVYLPTSFSAENCPYSSCSSSVVSMSQMDALVSTVGN